MITLRWLLIISILLIPVFSVSADNTAVGGSPVIKFEVEENLLTVKLSDMPLKNIFTEIADQTGIKFVFLVSLEKTFHTGFSRLPLEKALKQLLRGYNYSIIFGSEKSKGGEEKIRKVIVLSGEGDGYQGKAGTFKDFPSDPAPEPMSQEMLHEMEREDTEGQRQIGNEGDETETKTSGGSLIEEFPLENMVEEAPEEFDGGRIQVPQEGETENGPVNEEMLREIEREEMERGGAGDDEEGV
ncbi:MAG: hypothetical protein MRK01_08890 [Candidatus Scalindua sp.]|nr:hypothetical protein [Candidatus Scalindua sp.]